MDDAIQRLADIKRAFDEKKHALSHFGALSQWGSITDRAAANAAVPTTSETEESVSLRHSWASAHHEKWFIREIPIPAEAEGVSLIGSKAELLLWLVIGAEIYIDGQLKAKERFWATTLHLPITVADEITGETTHECAIRVPRGEGLGVFVAAELRADATNDVVVSLDKYYHELKFIHQLIEHGRLGAEASQSLGDAIERTALDSLAANDWDRFWLSTRDARELLLPYQPVCKEFTSYLIGHSHIDMNWMWPWEDTVETFHRDLSTADALMDEYPHFRFSQSQVAAYLAMKEHHPDLYTRIRERFAEGRWEITASTWVEGDVNMVAGESLVRQILYAGFYCQEEFGYLPTVCWKPDAFGHNAMMPQILAKSGIKYYYGTRAAKDHPLFWWEAPDGSRVLAVSDPYQYHGQINAAEVVAGSVDLYRRNGVTKSLLVFGVGNHGGGPTRNDLATLDTLSTDSLLPNMQCARVEDFFTAVENADDLPVWKDELNPYWSGCLTTHADVKRAHRLAENALHDAEVACSLAAVMGREYPVVELQSAWRDFSFNQFHDIICGCSIRSTYDRSHEEVGAVLDTANRQRRAAIDHVIDSLPSAGRSVLVFNSLSWGRRGVVECPVAELRLSEHETYVLEDAHDRTFPVQVSGSKAILEVKAPPLGYELYRIKKADSPAETTLVVDEEGLALENQYLRMQIHPSSGTIASLYDKEARRELAPIVADDESSRELQNTLGDLNVLQVVIEQRNSMAAWNIGSTLSTQHLVTGCDIEVLERGPVRGCIKTIHRYDESTITQHITLSADSRCIDFRTHVDWREAGDAVNGIPSLRVTFLPKLTRTQANFEIPFGSITRQADGTEMPALRWSDVSEADYGVALLNDCKYGHSIEGNRLNLTLIRSSYEPDPESDIGEHEFTYSLYPHIGNHTDALVFRSGRELNHPLLARAMPEAADGALPGSYALFSLEPENLNLCTVKATEAASETLSSRIDHEHMEVTLRIYETAGKQTEARLQSAASVHSAWQADMRENDEAEIKPAGTHELLLSVSPYEVKTIKLLVARRG